MKKIVSVAAAAVVATGGLAAASADPAAAEETPPVLETDATAHATGPVTNVVTAILPMEAQSDMWTPAGEIETSADTSHSLNWKHHAEFL